MASKKDPQAEAAASVGTAFSTVPSDLSPEQQTAFKGVQAAFAPPTAETPTQPIKRTVISPSNDPATAYLDTFKAPQTEAQIAEEKRRSAQGLIDANNEVYDTQLVEARQRGQERLDRNNSVNVLSGLMGSTEAVRTTNNVTAANQKEINAINAERAAKTQAIFNDISKSAREEAISQREDATRSAEAIVARRKETQTRATENLKLLAAGGLVDFDKFSTDPKNQEVYAHALDAVGGSEEALRAMFVINRPKEQIVGTPTRIGDKFVQAYSNPITGKVSYEALTLPVDLPPTYSNFQKLGDNLVAIPDNWDGDVSKIRTINGQKSGGAAGGGSAYGSDLDAIIGSTLSTIPTKFGQATFQNQISKARNDADKINLIAAQVLKGQPAEFKRDFTNQAVGISEIDKAIALIDSGVKTGVISNAAQYVFNQAGKDFDPKLAQINSHLVAAIQPYRNSVTGAAWGTQEDGEYNQLFGSTKYFPTELRQRLVSVKEVLKSKSAEGLNAYVNPMGYYDNQFASGAYAPGGSKVLIPPNGGEPVDASDLTSEEYQQALNDGYTPQ